VKLNERIKSFRLYMNLTQDELACRAGINEKYYGRIERGESIPTVEVVEKICNALNINIIELFLFEYGERKRSFSLNEEISKTIVAGLKSDVDVHFNRDVLLDKCSSCIWYNGYVGSMSFDEFELKLFASGNVRGSLFINYENILTLNNEDVSSDLSHYIKSDEELKNIIEYMPYDEETLKEKEGNALFLTESNWLSATLINHNTGEIVQSEVILDSDDIVVVLNDHALLFDLIFNNNVINRRKKIDGKNGFNL